MNNSPQIHQAMISISGMVQGVFFRDNARKKATELGLYGYVKNLPDGSVESLVQGKKKNIIEYVKWCNHGPEGARVDIVRYEWNSPHEKLNGFNCL